MSTQTYLLTLQPIDDFFFGSEHTFGADEERGEATRYRAVSERFPAQSTVIGMLRKTLLEQKGLMKVHKKGEWVDSKKRGDIDTETYRQAIALCGNQPFDYRRAPDLGIVRGISPLMLSKNGSFFLPAPADFGLRPTYSPHETVLCGHHTRAVMFENFDPKSAGCSKLVGSDGSLLAYEDCYTKVESVGIKKSRNGQTEENAFFLKESWKLAPDCTFALVVETSEALAFQKTLVTLGADRSTFLLSVKPIETDPLAQIASHIEANAISRVVTLGEAVVDDEAAALCHFVVGRRRRQRRILSTRNGCTKSDPFFRYESGTVFYTDDPETFVRVMQKHALQTTGVNRLIIKQGV